MKVSAFGRKSLFLVLVGILCIVSFSRVIGAPNPAVSIEQCDNGGVGLTPVSCDNPGNPNNHWGSGNVNGTKAHWQEGDFLPYRAILTNLNPGVNTATFSFDTAKSSELKHAIDYLGSYDATETTGSATPTHANQIDPCGDVFACTPNVPTTTAPITVPAAFTSAYPPTCANGGWSGSVIAGQIKAWSAAAGGVSAMSLDYPDSPAVPSSGDCTAVFRITFTVAAGTSNVVIAWGGHIASSANWGIGNIVPTGSPYHVHAGFPQESPVGSSFNVGSQDLQLASTAIVPSQTPTVTTELHNNASEAVIPLSSSVALGTNVHDKATVGGTSNGTPTGNVDFRFYTSSADCTADSAFTGGVTKGTVALSAGLAHPSTATGSLAPGTYAFKAKYTSNDASKWNDAIGSCEIFTVTKANTTTSTQVHNPAHQDITNTAVALGTAVHDNATVNTQVGSFTLGGTITYHFYSNSICSGSATSDQTVTISTESSQQTLGAGSYSYKADYSGDANYNSSNGICEPFSIDKAQLTTNTQVHNANHANVTNGSVPLGSVVHDTSTVSGVVGGFTAPLVSFTFYANGSCNPSGTAVANTGTEGGAVRSADSNTLGAGSYSYKASVGGDTNYLGNDSDCEPFGVSKAELTVSTEIHNDTDHATPITSAPLGSTVHDQANVGSIVTGFDPSANVSFTFYNNNICEGQGTAAGSVTVTAGIAHPSDSEGPLAAGSYSFRAHYPGDSNYNAKTAGCEPLTINKALLGVITNVHNAADEDITNTSVALGSITHDTATVSGGVAGFALPAVSFTLTSGYTNSCSNGSVVANNGTENTAVRSASSSALAANSYAYRATVTSNDNYTGSDSVCEPFAVNKANLGLVTEIHNGSAHTALTTVPLGSTVHDQADVSGIVSGFNPSANVSFTFYFNNTCSENGIAAGSAPIITAVAHPSSAMGPLTAGPHSFKANYPGDSNYNVAEAACEPLTVSKATPTVVTAIHNTSEATVTSVNAGSTVHDQATVGGLPGFDPTGSVDFSFYTNGTCADNGAASGLGIAVIGGIADPSAPQGPLASGSYSFKAHYNGNDNYDALDAACEPLTVNKLSPSIVTTPNPTTGTVGVTLNDSATLSGGYSPTGTISFRLFSPTDATCSGTPAFTNTINVLSGNGNYNTSAGFVTNSAGTWRWIASYSGDANNNTASGGCNDEQVTITAATTRTLGFWQTHYDFTSAKFNSGNAIWNICPTRTISSLGVLFGGFYASIPKTTTGAKRSALDQARMQLMQQLLAAILNHEAFGSGDMTLINGAKIAYCGRNTASILSYATQLDAFNNSGDGIATTQNTGSANPTLTKFTANLTAWNILP